MTTPETAFRDFRANLSRFLAKRLNNPADVEDVLQDVFLRAVRNEHSLRKAQTPLAWLYTVTKSALVDHYRKTGKDSVPLGDEVDQVPEMPQLDDPEFGKCLRPLINNLPAKYRDAIKFTDLEGGRQTELALQEGIAPSTAKSRVQRGRKMIQQNIMDCCRIERDVNDNVMALIPNGNCC